MQITSAIPLPEDEIVSLLPIKYKIGEIYMESPQLSYRNYIKFRQACKLLGIETLLLSGKTIPLEVAEQLTEIKYFFSEFLWWDELGLPWIIVKYSHPVDKKQAYDVLQSWFLQNPHIYHFNLSDWEIITDAEINVAIAIYMAANHTPVQIIEFMNELLKAQFVIKKKVESLLQKNPQESSPNMDSPLSPSARAALASIQKKRLRKQAISSSTPS